MLTFRIFATNTKTEIKSIKKLEMEKLTCWQIFLSLAIGFASFMGGLQNKFSNVSIRVVIDSVYLLMVPVKFHQADWLHCVLQKV